MCTNDIPANVFTNTISLAGTTSTSTATPLGGPKQDLEIPPPPLQPVHQSASAAELASQVREAEQQEEDEQQQSAPQQQSQQQQQAAATQSQEPHANAGGSQPQAQPKGKVEKSLPAGGGATADPQQQQQQQQPTKTDTQQGKGPPVKESSRLQKDFKLEVPPLLLLVSLAVDTSNPTLLTSGGGCRAFNRVVLLARDLHSDNHPDRQDMSLSTAIMLMLRWLLQGQKAKQEAGQPKKEAGQAPQGGQEKPKSTKAERRAKQEAERAAKEAGVLKVCYEDQVANTLLHSISAQPCLSKCSQYSNSTVDPDALVQHAKVRCSMAWLSQQTLCPARNISTMPIRLHTALCHTAAGPYLATVGPW